MRSWVVPTLKAPLAKQRPGGHRVGVAARSPLEGILDREIEVAPDEITPQVVKAPGERPQGLPHRLAGEVGAVGRHIVLVGQIDVRADQLQAERVGGLPARLEIDAGGVLVADRDLVLGQRPLPLETRFKVCRFE